MSPRDLETSAYLHAHGLNVAGAQLAQAVREAVASLPARLESRKSAEELPAGEAAALARSGFDLTPRAPRARDAEVRTTALLAALIEQSLDTEEAARRLGVNGSRVRQRLAARTLLGARFGRDWRIFGFQFEGRRMVPGIAAVFAVLDPELSPVAVFLWLTTPNPDLVDARASEEPLTPRAWLLAGLPLEPVVTLAKAL